jgi:hypothetical protein
MPNTLRTVVKRAVMTVLAGTILGLAPSIYDAAHFLSRSRVFEQMRIGLPETAAREILIKEQVACGISLNKEHSCWFSDLWRDYTILVDPNLKTINHLSYKRRHRTNILGRMYVP